MSNPFFSPESHSLNVGIATVTKNVEAALIFNHIFFWLKQNRSKQINQINGRTWMYDSVSAIAVHFPYLSEKQVKTALQDLVSHNYLIKAHHAEYKMDRRNWYALFDEELLGVKKQFTKSPTGPMHGSPQGQCNSTSGADVYKDTEYNTEYNTDKRGGAAPPAHASNLIERAKHVATSNPEHQKLILQHGQAKVDSFYQILSDWKEDTPRSKWKKNDYRSIVRWVVAAESERQKKSTEVGNPKEDTILAQKIWDKYKGRKECDIELGYKYIEFKNGMTAENLEFGSRDFRVKALEQLRKRRLNTEGL